MSNRGKIRLTARWRRRLIVIAVLVGAFFIGSALQDQLGLSFSIEGLQAFRQWVVSLGWWGPLVFVVLVVFRLFIGLSSHLILILGGLAFGAVGGTLWGAIGLLLSALVLFWLAQRLGAQWVEARFGRQYRQLLGRIRRLGAAAIFAITAHPVGLLTPSHLAAGLVSLNIGSFALAVALAAPLRAAPFAALGTAVLDLTGAQSLALAGVLAALILLPLLSPRVRAWIRGTEGDPTTPEE